MAKANIMKNTILQVLAFALLAFPKRLLRALAMLLVVAIAAGCLTGSQAQKKSNPSVNPPSTNAPIATGPLTLNLARYQKPLTTINGETDMFTSITGRQSFDGLPFQIDGQAILFGRAYSSRTRTNYPESVDGIRIGRKFDELHLIHYCAWLDMDGAPLARIRLNYADGSKYEFPILYGGEVRDWFQQGTEEKEQVADPNTKICWRSTGTNSPLGCLRLFKTLLQNPNPQKIVDSMDVISSRSLGSYVLVAATVAPHDPTRVITPPLAWMEPQTFAGSLVIHVQDKETGKPIEGAAAITIFQLEDGGGWAAPVYSSAGGEGVVRYPLKKTQSILITVDKDGYGSKMMQWQTFPISKDYTFQLSPATGKIGGEVLDENGQPVVGAEVRLQNYSSGKSGQEFISSDNLSARSDASGHWSIEGIPNGYQDFGVTVKHPDFPQAQFYAEGPVQRGYQGNHVITADFFSGKAALKLSKGNKLSGIVHDQTGKPLAGANVFVGFDRYMSGPIKLDTDMDGTFKLKNLALGDNYLTISAPGFAPVFRTVTIAATNKPLDVELKPGKVIHGRVINTAGEPVRCRDGYPDVAPDMWWFSPAVCRADGRQAPATEALSRMSP